MNVQLQRALLLIEQSRHDRAEQELRQLLTQSPDDGLAHAVLAICLAQRQELARAMQEVELAIHLVPEQAFVFYAKSIVLAKRNLYPEAQGAIEYAIGLDPNEPLFLAQLAQLQLDQRRWPEALVAAEQALELDPEDVTGTNLRALALVKLGRKIEAEETLGAALQRNPENTYLHANLGWSLVEQGRLAQSMEHFRESLRLNPTNEWARTGIVEVLKSRFFIYRVMLYWFLWMTKLSRKVQFGVLFGAYLGFLVLHRVAASNPAWAPWIMPLLIAYVTFAVMTWVADPLFNLVLRLDRFGRLALSKEQLRTSNRVGICLLVAVACVVAYFVTGESDNLLIALALGLLIPLLAHLDNCSPGWPRATILLLTIAQSYLATVTMVMMITSQFLTGAPHEVARAIGGVSFLVLILGAVASQFGIAFLVAARPRRESALAVWLVGGTFLGIAGLLLLAVSALIVWTAYYEGPGGPVIFDMPIRARLVASNGVDWHHAVQVNQVTNELEALGFEVVGDYVFEGREDVIVRYLLQQQESVVAELSEVSEAVFNVSLATVYTDGRVVAYVIGTPDQLEKPPQFTSQHSTASPAETYDRLRRERPVNPIRNVARDEVLALAEQLYNAEIDFLLGRGGPTVAEFRAIGADKGVELSDAKIRWLQTRWRKQAAERVDQFIVQRFLEANEPFRAARDRIFCVHELLTPEMLVRYYVRNRRPQSGERDTLSVLAGNGTRREAFQRMISRSNVFKKIGEVTEPIPADIYEIRE